MKKLIPLLSVILIFSNLAFSQEITNDEIQNNFGKLRTFDSRPKDLVGSSYIIEAFLPAKLANDEFIYSMRFNAYQDEMDVLKNGKEFSLKKILNFPITFINNNKIYEVYKYENSETQKLGFFVLLFKSEKINLLLKEKIKLTPEIKARTGYDKYQPPTLSRSKDKLYIGYKNNTTQELPSKKKDFFNLFSSDSKVVEEYVKKNIVQV